MITQTFKIVFKDDVLLDIRYIREIAKAYGLDIANPVSNRVLLVEPDQDYINNDKELQGKETFNILVAFLVEITLGDIESIGLIQQVVDYELNWEDMYI